MSVTPPAKGAAAASESEDDAVSEPEASVARYGYIHIHRVTADEAACPRGLSSVEWDEVCDSLLPAPLTSERPHLRAADPRH